MKIWAAVFSALILAACSGPEIYSSAIKSPPPQTLAPGTPEVGETYLIELQFTDLNGVYKAAGLPPPVLGKKQNVLAGHTDWESHPDKCVVTLWNRMFNTKMMQHEIWHCARGAYHPPHIVTVRGR